MRSVTRLITLGFTLLLCQTGPASAQYLRITTDNPGNPTRLRATGTTILTITLDTNHDKNGSLQSCNSHTAASCNNIIVSQPLDMFSYTLALKAVGGTVAWGTFTAADANYTDTSPQIQNETEVEINKARPVGTVTPPGLATLGSIPVTTVTGTPHIDVQIGASGINPFGFGTGFGTFCDGYFFPNTYVVGDPSDPCGDTTGIAGDWFDWDGAGAAALPNNPPALDPIANMTIGTGGCAPATADQAIRATDPDGQAITFTSTGPTFMTVTSNPQVGNVRTGNIHLVSPSSAGGPFTASVTASDVLGGSDTKSFTIQVAVVNQAPVLAQPVNMTVAETMTADQAISGSDACGAPLTFTKATGPSFMTVTTQSATTGTIHLAPTPSDVGTYSATVRATNSGGLSDSKAFTITVTPTSQNRPPTLAPVSNMVVCEGGTADQTITASDPDGDPLTFSKVAGPSYMTVFITTATTGRIHLAPGFNDAGVASATVRASDASGGFSERSFSITVINACGRPPVLTQPANMTVTEGMVADQMIFGSDADGDPLTFLKTAGPVFMMVSTTNSAGTGLIHLAPGFADSGTYTGLVTVSDGAFSDTKSFSITVLSSGNHCPTANAGGPYSGVAGVPINFNGTGSSDPDGNPLTYAWDFDASDGIQVDAVGPTVTHAYAVGGVYYVVTLTVTDNGDGDPSQACSDHQGTTALVAPVCDATIFNGYDTIRLGSGKPFWFAYVQPFEGCYNNSDVVIPSFVMKYAGRQISAVGKSAVNGDKSGDGIQEIKISFSKDDLRTLFTGTGLGNGHNTVTVTLEANLASGAATIRGTTQLDVVNNGSFNVAVSPNPLNPQATLSWTTSKAGFAKIEMFDIHGRLVRRLVDEATMAAGEHRATIDGRNQRGESLPSGVYFVRGTLAEGEFQEVITILK